LYVSRWFGNLDYSQLVLSGVDTFWFQGESKVGAFLDAKYALAKDNFLIIRFKMIKDIFKNDQVIFMVLGVQQ
jgi:hypothetical protein